MAQRRVLLDRLISSCRCRISTVRGLVSAEAVVRDVVRRSFRWRVPQPWYLISLISLPGAQSAGKVEHTVRLPRHIAERQTRKEAPAERRRSCMPS
jgi:hypothetical protein